MSSIEGPLSEKILGRFLLERISKDFIHNRRVPGARGGWRAPWRSERLQMIVCWDDWKHYCKAKVISEDMKADGEWNRLGYMIVRIPYFVQLDSRIVEYLFAGFTQDLTSFNICQQGFVLPGLIYPADFCEMGLNRFVFDLDRFGLIRGEIERSLAEAEDILGDAFAVHPPSLIEGLGDSGEEMGQESGEGA